MLSRLLLVAATAAVFFSPGKLLAGYDYYLAPCTDWSNNGCQPTPVVHHMANYLYIHLTCQKPNGQLVRPKSGGCSHFGGHPSEKSKGYSGNYLVSTMTWSGKPDPSKYAKIGCEMVCAGMSRSFRKMQRRFRYLSGQLSPLSSG